MEFIILYMGLMCFTPFIFLLVFAVEEAQYERELRERFPYLYGISSSVPVQEKKVYLRWENKVVSGIVIDWIFEKNGADLLHLGYTCDFGDLTRTNRTSRINLLLKNFGSLWFFSQKDAEQAQTKGQ